LLNEKEMNKTYLSLLICFFFAAAASAQNTKFERAIGGTGAENSYSIERTFEGGYIAVGYTESYGAGQKDVLITKTDALGKIVWSKAYGGSKDDVGWKVATTSDSGYIVVGTTNSFNSNNEDALMFKINSAGTVQWTKTFASDSAEDAYNITRSFFGSSFYVTGYIKNDSTGSDAFVAKINNAGVVRWYRKFGTKGNEEAYGISEDTRGNVIVCGVTNYDSITNGGTTTSSGTSDAFVAKLDSNGTVRWIKAYGTPYDDVLWDVKVDKNAYILAGWSKGNATGDNDVMFVSLDTGGGINVVSGIGTFGDDRAFDVVVKTGSKYTVVGYSDPNGTDRDIISLEYSSAGGVGNYAFIGGNGKDGHWPTDAVLSRDGGVMIFSTSNSYSKGGDDDWLMIKSDDASTVQCNSKFDIFNPSNYNTSSRYFGSFQSVTTGFSNQSPSLTTNTITSSIPDSTHCCKLVAEISAASYKVCEGAAVSLGKASILGLTYAWTDDKGNSVSTAANPSVKPSATTTYKLVVTSSDSKCAPDSAFVTVNVIAKIKYDFARDTAFCVNDSATFTTYSKMAFYEWKGKFINSNNASIKLKKADTIHFRGFDVNSCVYLDTMIVKVNSLPTFTLGPDTTICENAPVTLVGPSGMASYNWNSGQSSAQNLRTAVEQKHNLSVVDTNGCAFSDDVQVFTNPFSKFSLGSDAEFCEGGVYTILGPGALTGYIWNDTASTLQNLKVTEAGTYTLTAFNSFGCQYSDTIIVTTRNAPVFDLGDNFALCIGASKYLVGPTKMKVYSWMSSSNNDSLRITTSGTYILTVTDSFNCKYTDSIAVSDAQNPILSLGNDTTICIGDSLILNPGSQFDKYTWTTGASTKTITIKSKGTYGVNVVDNNGCPGSASITVDTMTCISDGIDNLNYGSFAYYPVPTTDVLVLDLEANSNDLMKIVITDVAGKVVHNQSFEVYAGRNKLNVNVQELVSGYYIVNARNSFGTASFKILVD
jgi:hypothetical protein